MLPSTLLDRARGSFLGLAIGDALGGPLEGLNASQIRAHYETVSDYVDGVRAWKRNSYRWRLPGLYTDDTQQALAIADTLIAYGHVDPNHLADLYLALAHPREGFVGAHRGVGRSFRGFLDKLDQGVPLLECSQDSAGIGAAMRIAPVAYMFAYDEQSLIDSVLAASLMTHRDIRSLAGAMAVALTIRRLLNGEECSASLLFRVAGDVADAENLISTQHRQLTSSIPEHKHSISQAIARVESILDLSRVEALHALVEEANCHGAKPTCKRPTMGFPPACIPTCLYLLLETDSFEDALIEVVNLGGDTDSSGAILGAMAGAYYGSDAIPSRWLEGLYNREGIARRAEALVGQGPTSKIPDLVETERRLTALEVASRMTFAGGQSQGGDRGDLRAPFRR